MKRKTALTIAGSDCSGGAGIQADIKTMIMQGVYGMSAITALTAQNTTGVSDVLTVSPAFLGSQLDRIFEDIPPDAVKIGMVPNPELMELIAQKLRYYQAPNVVVDPVMVATSGSRLMEDQAVSTMKARLLPLATLVTPNIPEAQVLSAMEIHDRKDMEKAALTISRACGCAVLVKGGHCVQDANDVLCRKGTLQWFPGRRIHNPNTHGTGCTLSSAIAAGLALGYDLETAIRKAKDYLSGALEAMLDLGQGSGPVDHGFLLTPSQKGETRL